MTREQLIKKIEDKHITYPSIPHNLVNYYSWNGTTKRERFEHLTYRALVIFWKQIKDLN